MLTRREFEASLNHPLEYWGSKTKEEVQELMGEDVAVMVGFEQKNPHHCYDLMQHVLHTAEYLKDHSETELKTAAFFHDIGKPETAFWKQDRLVFYGHAKKSGMIAEPILRRLGYSKEETDRIRFYIEHHDDFISWVLPEEAHQSQSGLVINEENVKRSIQKYSKDRRGSQAINDKRVLQMLIDLCEADAMAQADITLRNGKPIDSKEHKLKKVRLIRENMEKVFVKAD